VDVANLASLKLFMIKSLIGNIAFSFMFHCMNLVDCIFWHLVPFLFMCGFIFSSLCLANLCFSERKWLYRSSKSDVVRIVAIGTARAACAQSFVLWQQTTIGFMRRNHSIIACSPHVYILLFFAHILFVVNHTFNATPPEMLQHNKMLALSF